MCGCGLDSARNKQHILIRRRMNACLTVATPNVKTWQDNEIILGCSLKKKIIRFRHQCWLTCRDGCLSVGLIWTMWLAADEVSVSCSSAQPSYHGVFTVSKIVSAGQKKKKHKIKWNKSAMLHHSPRTSAIIPSIPFYRERPVMAL